MIDQAFYPRLQALNEKFAARVPGTLVRLRELRAAFNADAPDAATATELRQSLHTIAGSAATFGFPVFGQQARNLEQRMRVLMAFDVVGPGEWHSWLAAFDDYIRWAEVDAKSAHYLGQ